MVTFNTAERVRDIIKSECGVERERIRPDARLEDDLGLDSLDLLDLAMAIEEEFGIEFPDEDLPGLTTVGQLEGYVAVREAA